MADKRLAGMMDIKSLPFDAKRMILAVSESGEALPCCSARRPAAGSPLFAADRAIDGVDQQPSPSDELRTRARFGLVAIEGRG